MKYSAITPGTVGVFIGLIAAGIGYQQGWPLWVVILAGLLYGLSALMLMMLLRIWQASRKGRI